MKYLISLLALVLAVTMAVAQEPNLGTVEGAKDLEKVKRAKFRETYVNMEADWTQYNKIFFGDAIFDFRDVGPAEKYRSSSLRHSNKTYFGISDEDRQKFEDEVGKAFDKEFAKSKVFTISDTIDKQTILVRGGVIDIVSNVPPEFVGRSEIYLSRVGEATLILEFLDPNTGEILARVGERRAMQQPGGQIDMMSMPANSVTVWAEVRRWARNAAVRLRKELDDAMQGK
jgi:hypothetical protein